MNKEVVKGGGGCHKQGCWRDIGANETKGNTMIVPFWENRGGCCCGKDYKVNC